MHHYAGEAPRGDLSDAEFPAWFGFVAPNGVDAPCDPVSGEGDRDEELQCWKEWQGYAMARGRPMTTFRHVFESMVELGLIERREDQMGVSWVAVSLVPYVDEVLPLTAESRERVANMRWRLSFSEVGNAILDWIRTLRVPSAANLEIAISIEALAAELNLDPEDARHGLAVLIDEDIQCDVDPESAKIDAPLKLVIDWKLFEEWRTIYGLTP